MDSTTINTIEIAKVLGRRGFTVASVEVHTPDGRTWQVVSVPTGRGRHADGPWGSIAGAPGGFRLFEVDHDEATSDEHDAVDGDIWSVSDLIDYLDAVGQPKGTAIKNRSNNNTQTT